MRGNVRIVEQREAERVPEQGAVSSVQEAEAELEPERLDRIGDPERIGLLANGYWRFVSRVFLGLVRVIGVPGTPSVVLLTRRLPLLCFSAPEYEGTDRGAAITWRIRDGLLVAREGRGQGALRIEVRRTGPRQARVRMEVRNFYPWLRGRGRFARFGTWLYGQTQLRIHVAVCNGFLRSLGRAAPAPSPRNGRELTAEAKS